LERAEQTKINLSFLYFSTIFNVFSKLFESFKHDPPNLWILKVWIGCISIPQ
jgi:hypothetical protein